MLKVLLFLLSIISAALFADIDRTPYLTVHYTGKFLNQNGEPLVGAKVRITADIRNIKNYTHDNIADWSWSYTLSIDKIVPQDGIVHADITYRHYDDNGGEYYIDCVNDECDGPTYQYRFDGYFDGWQTPYIYSFSMPELITNDPYPTYIAYLDSPENSNSIVITQQAINKYLIGKHHDNDSRITKSLSLDAYNGTLFYSFQLNPPQIRIVDNNRNLEVLQSFNGTAKLTINGVRQIVSLSGKFIFNGEVVKIDGKNEVGLMLNSSIMGDISTWMVFDAGSAQMGSIFYSEYCQDLKYKFKPFIPMSDQIITGTISGLYSETSFGSPVCATSMNSSNPNLSTLTINLKTKLLLLGL